MKIMYILFILLLIAKITYEEMNCGTHGTWDCQQCFCDDFWRGIDCSICSGNKGCSDSTFCSTSPFSVVDKRYQCGLESGYVTLLGVQYFLWNASVIEVSPDASYKLLNISMDAWASTKGPIVMSCFFPECTANDNEKEMNMECLSGTCECVSACLPILQTLSQGSLRTIQLNCPANQEFCTLSTPGLGGIKMDCIYGECVESETIPSKGSASTSTPSSTIIIYLLIFFAAVFVVLFFVFWSILRKFVLNRYRPPVSPEILQAEWREFQSKEIIGATLTFRDITYVTQNSDWMSQLPARFSKFGKKQKEEPKAGPKKHSRDAGQKKDFKVILRHISGTCRPGEITAVMGPSGAGKTSLLNILADWKDSTTYDGELLVNGEKIFRTFRKTLSAYVLQEDHLIEWLTVSEMMMFVAQLRIDKHVSDQFREQRIDEVLRELKLDSVKDTVIGNPAGIRGLSGGERRRLSIAIELLSSPRILFLDEPTSGLDSSSAYTVMDSVRRLASENRTIICTIHQPRMSIFNMCDSLLLLCQGRVVYSGPTRNAVSFFESQGIYNTVADNAADFLIDAVGALDHQGVKQIERAWKVSGHKFQTRKRTPQLPQPADPPATIGDNASNQNMNSSSNNATFGSLNQSSATAPESLSASAVKAANRRSQRPAANALGGIGVTVFLDGSMGNVPVATQTEEVREGDEGNEEEVHYEKLPRSAWKNPGVTGPWAVWILCQLERKKLLRNVHLLRTHLLVNVLAGLLMGLIFYNTKNDLNGLQSKTGCLFLILTVVTFSTLSSLEIFIRDRTIFLVQKTKGYYTAFSYLLSKVFLQVVPLHGIAPMILAAIVFHLAGLNNSGLRFLRFLVVVVLHSMVCVSLILCLSGLFSSFAVANLLATMVLLGAMVFSGFLINSGDIPPYMKWIYDASFFRYSFEDLVINEFEGETYLIQGGGITISVSGESFLGQYGMNAKNFDFNIFLLSAVTIVLLVLTYCFLHWRTLRENHRSLSKSLAKIFRKNSPPTNNTGLPPNYFESSTDHLTASVTCNGRNSSPDIEMEPVPVDANAIMS